MKKVRRNSFPGMGNKLKIKKQNLKKESEFSCFFTSDLLPFSSRVPGAKPNSSLIASSGPAHYA